MHLLKLTPRQLGRIAIFVGVIILLAVTLTSVSPRRFISKHTPMANTSYIALCLTTKDDADVLEWITYHNRLGVSKFYVYDYGSSHPVEKELGRFIDSGLVDYVYGYGNDPWYIILYRKYISSYHHRKEESLRVLGSSCVQQYASRHEWISHLMPHEYIVVANKSSSIASLLVQYNAFCGIEVRTRVFGSSGLVSRPATVLGRHCT
jgi:hypothetical protein